MTRHRPIHQQDFCPSPISQGKSFSCKSCPALSVEPPLSLLGGLLQRTHKPQASAPLGYASSHSQLCFKAGTDKPCEITEPLKGQDLKPCLPLFFLPIISSHFISLFLIPNKNKCIRQGQSSPECGLSSARSCSRSSRGSAENCELGPKACHESSGTFCLSTQSFCA